MADVPPPRLDDPRSAPLRNGFGLFVRGLIYALAFWSVYAILYRAPWAGSSTTDQDDPRSKQAWKIYEQQQAQAEKVMAMSEAQHKRMDAIITKQEELNRRFEAVIANWEQQSGAKR